MKHFLAAVFYLVGLGLLPAQAVQYDEAKITKIVDGDAVFINQKKPQPVRQCQKAPLFEQWKVERVCCSIQLRLV